MQEIIDVDTGQVAVRRGRFILRANALGSCIAVVAYDRRTRTGGMAHVMLPDQAPPKAPHKSKYASDAIDDVLRLMAQTGSQPEDIEVCLVGAGNVLRKPDDTICSNNIRSVSTILNGKKIPVRASRLGGYDRKSAVLDTDSGCVSFTQGDRPRTDLWQFTDSPPGNGRPDGRKKSGNGYE